MKILLAVFLTLTSYFDAGQSNEVCLSLSQAGAASASQLELAQGPPGRRGPQGPVGHKGDTGDPGQCGCNPSEIEQLRRQIDLLRAESCIGGFIYDGSCIKLLYTRGSGGNYDQAVRDCSINNGSLVEITSDRKYDLVVKYVNRTWDVYDNGRTISVNIWLGLSYTPSEHPTQQVTLNSSGRKVTSSRWYPGYPRSGTSKTRVMIQVGLLTGRPSGVFNYQPSYTTGIPFCQYNLK